MATTQSDRKGLVHEHFQAWEDRDLDGILAMYADDYETTFTLPTGEERELDRDGLREMYAGYFDMFADMSVEVHEMAAEDEWVLARVELTATHDGEFYGIEPTGNEVEVQEHVSYRFDGDEVVEVHSTADVLGLLRQLDVDLPFES